VSDSDCQSVFAVGHVSSCLRSISHLSTYKEALSGPVRCQVLPTNL